MFYIFLIIWLPLLTIFKSGERWISTFSEFWKITEDSIIGNFICGDIPILSKKNDSKKVCNHSSWKLNLKEIPFKDVLCVQNLK